AMARAFDDRHSDFGGDATAHDGGISEAETDVGHWRGQGWTDNLIRHWRAVQHCERDEAHRAPCSETEHTDIARRWADLSEHHELKRRGRLIGDCAGTAPEPDQLDPAEGKGGKAEKRGGGKGSVEYYAMDDDDDDLLVDADGHHVAMRDFKCARLSINDAGRTLQRARSLFREKLPMRLIREGGPFAATDKRALSGREDLALMSLGLSGIFRNMSFRPADGKDRHSERFLRERPTFNIVDGWASFADMFAHQRGGKGHPTATKHTGPDEASMGAATMMAEAVDHTGKQQNRLEIKGGGMTPAAIKAAVAQLAHHDPWAVAAGSQHSIHPSRGANAQEAGQRCRTLARLAIACDYLHQRQMDTFAANVAEGTGADIPALLAGRVLRDSDQSPNAQARAMEQVIGFAKRHLVIGLMKNLFIAQVDRALADRGPIPRHAMDAHDSTSGSPSAATESIGRDPHSTFSFMIVLDVLPMQGGN
ncbi:unnamed protein product, partial [Prorocentrum cordatum]